MTGKLALVVHPETEVARRLGAVLSGAGLKVVTAADGDAAAGRLSDFFTPDVLLATLEVARDEEGGLVRRLRANPLTQALPVVVLGVDGEQERRLALRLGLTHLVAPPYDGEEVVLATRLAIEQHRDDRLVSGSLKQMAVSELLQTAEISRRSGTVVVRSRGQVARLWLSSGRVVDAEIDDGRRGREAVFAVAVWEEGSFEADFRPVSVPERISESTSHLLLEAMRRRDEAQRRDAAPPSAALEDPPPPPPRPELAEHRALTLLNVAAAYACDHLRPRLVSDRLERWRRRGGEELLERFSVAAGGLVAVTADSPLTEAQVEPLAAAVGRWLRDFFTEQERALPGRFPVRKLRALTVAVEDDLESLGFYRALGLETVGEEYDQ